MLILSDNQAQQLSGGCFSPLLRRGGGASRQRGISSWFRSNLLVLRAIITNVNQVNFAINLALNGGTVINNQVNVLSINARV